MIKILVFLAIIVAGCNTTTRTFKHEIYYIQDDRTDLCFAVRLNFFDHIHAMSNVPCTKEVKDQIHLYNIERIFGH